MKQQKSKQRKQRKRLSAKDLALESGAGPLAPELLEQTGINLRAQQKRDKQKNKAKKKKGSVKVRHQVKLPNGQWMTAASLPTALANSSTAGAPSTVAIVTGKEAADGVRTLLKDPWADNPIARWPDQYTMMPTFAAKDIAHFPLTIYNGTTSADGSAAFYIRGDPNGTYAQPTQIGSPTSSSSSQIPNTLAYNQINWSCSPTDMNASMPHASSYAALARPVGMGTRFTYSGVGPYHTIVARVMELPPWAWVGSTTAPTNFPTYANLGPTFAQREYFRAREIALAPGETLSLLHFPASYMGLTFLPCDNYRETSPNAPGQSWTGYVVWFYGLQSGDTIYTDVVLHHEYYVLSITTTPATNPTARVLCKPDVDVVQNVESEVVDLAAYGWNVFKDILTTAVDIFGKIAPYLPASPNSMKMVQPCVAGAPVPTVETCYSLLTQVIPYVNLRSGRFDLKSLPKPLDVTTGASTPQATVPVEHRVETKTDEEFDFPRRESLPMATPRQSIGPRSRNAPDDDTSSLKSSSSALARAK